MNTELRQMIVQAEGRYLTDVEMTKVREYAMNMTARIEVARRLQAKEEGILAKASTAFAERFPAYFKTVPDAHAKTRRDMALTLRYVAQAHVRSDPEFFRVAYAEWIGDLLSSIVPTEVLISGQECLRQAIDDELDAVDAKALNRFVEMFIDALRKRAPG